MDIDHICPLTGVQCVKLINCKFPIKKNAAKVQRQIKAGVRFHRSKDRRIRSIKEAGVLLCVVTITISIMLLVYSTTNENVDATMGFGYSYAVTLYCVTAMILVWWIGTFLLLRDSNVKDVV